MAKNTNTPKTTTETITPKDVGTMPAGIAKGPETIQTPTAVNKASIANAIFDACYKQSPVPQRKDILAKVREEAGLTEAGAATYLQNYKRKHGLSKTTAPAAGATDDGDKPE